MFKVILFSALTFSVVLREKNFHIWQKSLKQMCFEKLNQVGMMDFVQTTQTLCQT